ncbi:MAG: hypothetical protein ACHQ5A_07860 [Opitutales bacterium]
MPTSSLSLRRLLTLLAVAALGATGLPAKELGKAADNKIYAQQLVNELMAGHPELLVVGLHAIAPGATEQTMIATNLDRIGKADDEDDVAVFKERKIILCPNAKESNKFEVQISMIDATGRLIGAYGFVFRYKAGDDEVEMLRQAKEIRRQLGQKIPSLAALFAPVP